MRCFSKNREEALLFQEENLCCNRFFCWNVSKLVRPVVSIPVSIRPEWLPGAYLEEICRYTDLFLYDVKTADPQKFEAYIGKGFREACEHLRKIAGQGAGVIVRIPVIPGFNDDKKSVQETIRFLQTMPVLKEVNLLPFHRTGADKYKRLGMDWEMGDLPGLKEEDLKDIREMFREQGFRI